MHSKGIAHLDLSPSNILVLNGLDNEDVYNHKRELKVKTPESEGSEKRYLYLTNFCLSCGFFKKKFSTNKISSLYFMAPERISGELEQDKESQPIMKKVDMWSLGVIIYIMVFGTPPFEGNTTS